MAQIEQSDGGKKKKGAQKKIAIHVDFTPMVDMNMLLITFFMLCTTMIKSQTLSIALPAPPDEEQTADNSETVAESTAITLIIDTERNDDGTIATDGNGKAKDVVYYYSGFEPTIEDGVVTEHKLETEQFIGNTTENGKPVQNGIRKILHDRNAQVLGEIEKAKEQWRNGTLPTAPGQTIDEAFDAKAREIRNNADYTKPQVTIKATDRASWESVISALDEMQINQISQYRIGTFTSNDSLIIADYKTINGIK